ncbi:Nipped-B-like protein B [Colletotrichum orbiculare MAFF 240422]|uniref:Nipped-B-like protein B n=1 Tax=Colletotrichum orbiculare (strain 104-T / ATCC 96160 / CBS 514.97 / LARS 414 / MAFF 240422) TaxID=1213857 RepID=N4VS61_COLOR|nr:Nipped-B-like protein B [Colletotrichum orbiculare MAFF 240422]
MESARGSGPAAKGPGPPPPPPPPPPPAPAPVPVPDDVSSESSASDDEDDGDDIGAYSAPTPPPQRRPVLQHQQTGPPPPPQQPQAQPHLPPPPPLARTPPQQTGPRGSRERDVRGDRHRERDSYIPRERDKYRDGDRERDRDSPRIRDRHHRDSDRDSPRIRERHRDSDRDSPRIRNKYRDSDKFRDSDRERDRERSVPRDRDKYYRDDKYHRGSDRDRESPPFRDAKRQSVVADNAHARRQSVPANDLNGGSKRQSITERLMSTWTARTAKEPPPSGGGPLPSRRASVASAGPKQQFNPVARVREWLDTCNAEHEDHCSGPPADTWRPIWLIDSVNRCLVRARAADRYIALSYVYEPPLPSTRGPVETLRENLDMLTATLDDADVPQTILDAMWLARKLGIKYLWVDRFCIVQDDDVERDEYIRNMAYVYANAYLTIVAAAGDAETGLTALLKKTPPPRGGPAKMKHDDLVLSSRWAGRAWTVQEGMYSRRKVFVFDEVVTWECHCEVWQGAPAPGRFSKILKGARAANQPCSHRPSPAALGYLHPVWPDMDEFARIAMDYSARRVTLMSDTMRALRGITTVLDKSYAGGFVFGMPVCFLDIAMLWQPRAMVRRRMMIQPVTGLNPLPSWSWLGWHYDGVPADMTLWRAACDYVQDAPVSGGRRGDRRYKSPYAFRLRPLVNYELTDRATYTRLPSEGLMYRDRRQRRTQPLPAGWSRNSGGGFRYAGDPEVLFRYPVPVGEMSDPTAAATVADFPPGATLLSFSTTVAFLEVDFALARNGAPADAKNSAAAAAVSAAGGPAVAAGGPGAGLVAPGRGYGVPLAMGNIWSRTGKWCGVVTAHDSWLGLQGANHTGEEKLEFIAISTASERGGSHVFDIDAFRDNMDEDEIVDFVNVLWVERVGGVCYRRGLGHVVQRVWDAVARDRVEILLG